ncbi:pantoate kinase [Thermoproteus tenax]|uniref:Pantoate kinase n=1 Tax=Thermoproteus tenax (strain ATCC 35583 / DSM 2078 / JCM 9277 / NBRC 100435 / Kra 1) TaxID=768679 RepID=G4RJH9_THETK|nr:pantoate kinase [Thermoproteus tenax]CCC81724.1 sugar kinase superfamily enzyme [Thermoproteus tenax Kra 1]
MSAVARVPLHVTSIWLPHYADDPLATGSVGCGVLLEPGAEVYVRLGPGPVDLPHIQRVISLMGASASASYRSPVELGYGYGLSGALALGTALGLAALLGRTPLEAAQIAHIVEVELRTGLGDVIAEFHGGGIELRTSPGAPGVGRVERIDPPRDLVVLTSELNKIPTPEMLRALSDKLSSIAPKYLRKIFADPTYETFARASMEFSEEVGFLNRELKARAAGCLRYGDALYVKKGVLVFLTRSDEADYAEECLRSAGLKTKRFLPSLGGASALRLDGDKAVGSLA